MFWLVDQAEELGVRLGGALATFVRPAPRFHPRRHSLPSESLRCPASAEATTSLCTPKVWGREHVSVILHVIDGRIRELEVFDFLGGEGVAVPVSDLGALAEAWLE